MHNNRILAAFLGVAFAAAAPAAVAADGEWLHATALIGTPKYPAEFKHFDYVNPDAPKGGLARFSVVGSFDTLNPVPPKGALASGIGAIYDTLMTSSLDELSAEYGQLADGLKYPPDLSSVTYRLRAEARWHDGNPLTADDVVWSFNTWKEFNPNQAFYYRHVIKAEKTGDREVTFTFDETGNRELPHIVGQLMILPRHYWEGVDANGAKRDISKQTLEPPLGSGAYRVKSVKPGSSVAYELVPDYWGKDVPSHVGTENIAELRYEYFRDETVQMEAFKADQFDYKIEPTAVTWATRYDFPAVKDGRVKLEVFENGYRRSGVMVGFTFNLNRERFKDIRVRQAFNLVMPFEDMNKTLFFNQYAHISSYFYDTPLGARGLPTGRELEILTEVKDKVPPEVFTKPYANPINETPTQQRDNLREALRLLGDAGWELKGNDLVNKRSGEKFAVEYITSTPTFDRVAGAYQAALKKIGIDMSFRILDTAQYTQRVRTRDFDMIYTGWPQSMSPGNEQLDFWGADAAKREGSRNYAAIQNPAIDTIIQKIIFAKDRDDLVAATKALDRVLLWNQYVVPGWTLLAARTARWDRYSHAEPLPEHGIGFPTIWWYDEAKAAKVGVAR
ncbi:MAG: extracellular solute-binding protein [Bauldia sp.]